MQKAFGVRSITGNNDELTAALYLQVSIISQALIFVTRSRSWSFIERPGLLLVSAFVAAQLVSFASFTREIERFLRSFLVLLPRGSINC